MKKVSVIIPTYKVENYIAAAVESVLNQTYHNFELLIVDDGSPDRSVEICQQFDNSHIKIIQQVNQGVAAARNNGIRHAEGEYIAFLDGDDIWLPEKLEKHVAHLESSPQVGVSFSRSAFIDAEGKPLGIYQISKLEEITPLDLLCRTPIGNGSVPVIRQEVFKSDGCYFDEDRELHPSEDVECWLRIAIQSNWKIEGVPEALTLYRINPTSHSAQIFKKLKSWQKLLEKLRSYTPEKIGEWESPAMAYQLRHLARRAFILRDGKVAKDLIHRALATHWRIILEEPQRTLLTLAAVYSLSLLPQFFYKGLEDLALKVTSANQKRRLL